MLGLSLIASLLLAACASSTGGVTPAIQSVSTGTIVTAALADNVDSHAQPDDVDYDESTAVRITLNGATASSNKAPDRQDNYRSHDCSNEAGAFVRAIPTQELA